MRYVSGVEAAVSLAEMRSLEDDPTNSFDVIEMAPHQLLQHARG